jgi:hypothetical protein
MPWNRTRGYFEGAVFALRSNNRAMTPSVDRDLLEFCSCSLGLLRRYRIKNTLEGSRESKVLKLETMEFG